MAARVNGIRARRGAVDEGIDEKEEMPNEREGKGGRSTRNQK